MDHTKYRAVYFSLNGRTWPDTRLTSAPRWCSVDLRDGNQALTAPMSLSQKLFFFKFLTGLGFKEIETSFPAASETEYKFTRTLIDNGLIPSDVAIQVLTQARDHIIDKTFTAVRGVKKCTIHLYNSTSPAQRRAVFGMDKKDVILLAVRGARRVMEQAVRYGRERFNFEYSPESFSATEPGFALEIISAVLDIWRPDATHKTIINLPSTVETAPPNVFADQVEYICKNIPYRDAVVVSLHTHNDRGCAVAAAELGLMAGAERVEGTLFGNGERTGNADIVSLALNLYARGVDPGLDFSDIENVIEIYESSTLMPVHARHPYAGELAFTAFSGSHQDAINKCLAAKGDNPVWDIPYLPIDPADVGRDLNGVIRINAQSGKSGVAYILERDYKLTIPKAMRRHFAEIVTRHTDGAHREFMPEELYALFEQAYINVSAPLNLIKFSENTNGDCYVTADVALDGSLKIIEGRGNGLLSAFCRALENDLGFAFEITNYSEHSLEYGSRSRAITYVQIAGRDGAEYFGAGVSESVSRSSVRAVVSAVNRMVAPADIYI